MKNLFVITASNPSAKKHIESTVNAPVPPSKVEKHFTGSELAQVKAIGSKDGYYAWGSVPGDRNTSTWERMQVGDHVLIYQNQTYTYYTRVLLKAQNSGFAVDNWGFDPQHRTWEYIYFLEKPLRFSSPVYSSALANYLPTRYMGFTQITNERLSRIESDHGSLEAYLEKAIPDFDPHHHRSRGYWWVNQGKTYSEERAGGFIWAPNRDRGGGVPVHWSTMKHVRAGDVLFNYANGSIRAVSTTKGSSYDYENQVASAAWDRHGQRVDLEYHEIEPLPLTKIQPFIQEITGRIESGNSPYDSTGGIKQGYLFNYSLEAARIVRRIHGKPFPEPVESYLTETEVIAPVQRDPIIDLMLTKKQVILYGPPGTGKTFDTRRLAVLLLTG